MDREQPAKEGRLPRPSDDLASLRGLIRWRLGVAGVTLVAAVGVTVLALYPSASASEFGPLALMGMTVSLVLPLLLLGLVSLVIARGLGRPPLPTLVQVRVQDRLIRIVAVVVVTIALFPIVFGIGSAIHAAPKMGGSILFALRLVSYYLVIPLLSIGLALLVARALGRTPLSAMKLALVQDVLILVVAAARVVPTVFPNASRASLHMPWVLAESPTWLWALLALSFGAEAAHLLRARWRWRPAWPVFAVLAAGLVWAGIIAPAVLTARLAREARPLLDYVARHWVAIPPGARVSITGPCRAAPHPHTIHLQAEHVLCWINAEHVRDGRWTCSRGMELTGAGGPGLGTFFLRSEPIRGARSVEEARELLRRCGVVDTGLSFERAARDRTLLEYEFWSPLGQGRYRVSEFGHINFYLEQPLEVP